MGPTYFFVSLYAATSAKPSMLWDLNCTVLYSLWVKIFGIEDKGCQRGMAGELIPLFNILQVQLAGNSGQIYWAYMGLEG